MIYFDTCFMLKCFVPELGHREVQDVWRRGRGAVCCEIGRAEFIAAVHRNLREGKITAKAFRSTVEDWNRDQAADHWTWVPMKEELFEEVTGIFERLPATVYLRSSDALHLASVRMLGLTEIYTSDRHLMRAAEYLGIAPRNVIPAS